MFRWFETTPVGAYGRHSSYFFPAVEVVHLLGLTLLLGSVIAVNLRLLGFIQRHQSVTQVLRGAGPLLWLGAALTMCSGALLFLTEAVKCYYNQAFWWKMALLATALLFQSTVQPRLMRLPQTPTLLRMSAVTSLLLWFGVGIAGRAIAFI